MSSPANPSQPVRGGPDDAVTTLLTERNRLKVWLARIDESAAGVPPHIAERVRADYETRLRQVLDDLRPLAEDMRARFDSVDAELHAAERAWAESADKLEEARLRHLAGELDDDGWAQRSPALQKEVDSADEVRSRLRGEWDQMRSLLREIDPPAEPEPDPAPEPILTSTATEAISEEDSTATVEEILSILDGRVEDSDLEEVAVDLNVEEADDLPWVELLDAEAELEPDDARDADLVRNWIGSDDGAPDSALEAEERDHVSFLEELDRSIAMAPAAPFGNAGFPGGWPQHPAPYGAWPQPGMPNSGPIPAPDNLPGGAGVPEPNSTKVPHPPAVSSDEEVGCVRCGAPSPPGEWYCERCTAETS